VDQILSLYRTDAPVTKSLAVNAALVQVVVDDRGEDERRYSRSPAKIRDLDRRAAV
jgi:hypothetical protein